MNKLIPYIAIGGFIVLIVWLFKTFPGALDQGESQAHLAYMLLFLAMVASGGVAHYAGQGRQALRDAAIWLGVIAVLIVGYSYRDVFLQSRLVGALMPSRVQVLGDGSLRLQADERGHFFMQAEVNGSPVRFMVDTGASGVVLTKADAERAGIAVERLSFGNPHSTANGFVLTAKVKLSALKVGHVVVYDFPAYVNGGELDVSLLGNEFLKEFATMQRVGNTLILIP